LYNEERAFGIIVIFAFFGIGGGDNV